MFDPTTNTLVFPHIIAGSRLAGRQYTYNNVNGGVFPLARFNIIQHQFFGGNVEFLGLISEYGFYICPDRQATVFIGTSHVKRVNGFYLHDPYQVTEVGKQILAAHFPGVNIVYEKVSATPNREMSSAEIKHKLELIEEAKEKGVSPVIIEYSKNNVEELQDAIKTQEAGKSEIKPTVSDGVVVQTDVVPQVVHRGVQQAATIRRGVR